MKIRNIILTSLFLIVFLAGCGKTNNKPQSIVTHTEQSTNTTTTENTNTSNKTVQIIKEPVTDAEKVPQLFYQYINKKQYNDATKLLSPGLQFEGDPSLRKYWVNLEHVDITYIKDISSSYNSVNRMQVNYYAMKVYYANLTIKVKDKNLVPSLIYPQHRRFVVIKTTKNGPWLLDEDAEVSPM